MKLTGQVSKKLVAEGSKSEREAVILSTGDQEYILSRKGGNPYQDDVLDALVGKRLECEGTVRRYKFMLSDWKELE